MTEVYTKTSEAISKVRPNKYYDMTELENLLWWTPRREYLVRYLDKDQELYRCLEVEVTGSGKGKRYKIKGKSIIKFLKTYGPGIELIR